MWPWQTMLASAVGAAIPLGAIYVFGFRQVIAAKDARIDVLKDQVERLKGDTAPTVILERKALIEEIEARAQEKERIEADTQKEVDRITAEIGELSKKIREELRPQVATLRDGATRVADLAQEKILTNTQVGILTGRMSLTKTLYWLNGLTEGISDPVARSLETFVRGEMRWLDELRSKVRDEAHVLTLEDIPFSQERMNDLKEQARAERTVFDRGESIEMVTCPPSLVQG
jgi:hypothetical protein